MNWGKGITIFMIAFMTFIGSMVYMAFSRNADLVRDDYYENELVFDQTKQEKANYEALNAPIHIEKNEEGITFLFPQAMENAADGKIQFYRPDQKKYDREFDLAFNEERMQKLAYDNFKEGYYSISVTWKDRGEKGYIFESSILF